jgi:hypothetical protein
MTYMKYLKLKQSLSDCGINPRFSIDVASVAERVRDFGLLHIEINQKENTIEILKNSNCKIIKSRDLKFTKDSESREGMMYDIREGEKPTHSEVWYCSVNKEVEPNFDPFLNPGKYLGYPSCCVEKYETTRGMGLFYSDYLFDNENTRYNEINRLCTLFNPNLLMPDFFPCSLSCKNARDFSIKIQSIINQIYSTDEIQETNKYSYAALIIFSEKLYCFTSFRIEDESLFLIVDEHTQYLNLIDILDRKYWPKMIEKNLLIKFKNTEKIKKVYIESNSIIEEIKI